MTTRARQIAWLVAVCYFMEMLDGTIVVTAAPRLRAALHVSSSAIGLLMAAYLIVVAVVIPLGGWLVVRLGVRRLFVVSIVVFTLASLACGASQNFAELMVARVVQGVGAACMVPVGRMLVLAKAEKTDLMRLLAYIFWPGLLAPAVAPLLGGLIITYANWHWLFWLNVPIGAVAALLGLVLLDDDAATTRPVPLDWWGMVVTSLGLAALLWAAYQAGETTVPWRTPTVVALVGLAALAEAVRHLTRTAHPYVALSVLSIRSLRDAVLGLSVFVTAISAVPLLLPLLFQDHFHWSPVKSGLVVLGVFVGNIAMKPGTTPVLNRVRHKPVLVASTFLVALSLVAFAFVGASTPLVLVLVAALVSGAARSMGFTTYFTLFYSDVPEARMNAATTVTATVQQLFSGIGLSAAVVLLRVGASVDATPLTSATSFRWAFMFLTGLALLATVAAGRLEADAGRSVRSGSR